MLQHDVNRDHPAIHSVIRFNGFGIVGIVTGLLYFFLAFLAIENKPVPGPSINPAFPVAVMAPFTDYASGGFGFSEFPPKPAVAGAKVTLQP